jgi:hypothetical protein
VYDPGRPDHDIGVDLEGRGIGWSYPDLTGFSRICSTLDLLFKNGQLERTAIGQT